MDTRAKGHDPGPDDGGRRRPQVGHDAPHGAAGRIRPGWLWLGLGAATLVLAAALLAASAVIVPAGTAMVITRFGQPVRVIGAPGLAWRIPAPVDAAVPVDLRLRTTSSSLLDVATKDGVRILVQAFAAWQVAEGPDDIQQFVRSVRNDPDEAARGLRAVADSVVQDTAGRFDLADLVNADPSRVKLAAFEQAVQTRLAGQMRRTYGIAVRQVGIERLSLPDATLAATVVRMRSEREAVAAQRTAEGLRDAAQIRADAGRDSRIIVADAQTQAATIEAESRRQAAEIQARAYSADPQLYMMLRSLDTLGAMIGPNTRLVLRTDAAPFNVLVQGPPAGDGGTDAGGK